MEDRIDLRSTRQREQITIQDIACYVSYSRVFEAIWQERLVEKDKLAQLCRRLWLGGNASAFDQGTRDLLSDETATARDQYSHKVLRTSRSLILIPLAPPSPKTSESPPPFPRAFR